jgi:predicted chitinase
MGAAKAQGITDPAQVAYMLATAEHETDAFNTMHEYASGSEYEGRDDLGNTQAAGDGVRFKGRGFAQLTGRANYAKLSAIVGADLINNPDLAAQPDIAAKIFAYGMKNGSYTGQRLGDYVNGNRVDFYNARRIVNGTDRAGLIAGYAQKYYDAIKSTLSSATASTSGNCGGSGAPLAGSVQQRIYQSAKNAYGESTASGPGGGNVACAWEVSRVLKRAGITNVSSDGVPELVNQIKATGGAQIAASQAQPGDIVIAHDMAHVGVCMNAGCTQVLSNSSSQAAFKWQSNTNFDGYYGGASYGVFRVKG